MKISNSTDIMHTLDSKLLFNIDIPEKVINNLISDDTFPCLNYIYHINRLLMKQNFERKDISIHKKVFYDNRNLIKSMLGIPNVLLNEKVLFDENNCLLSQFSCINLIERILKYGKFKNNEIYDYNDQWLTRILLLNIFETQIDEENEFEEEITYGIVGATEANIAENKISNESPVGKALIGKKKGEEVEVETPGGIAKYKILDIKRL